MRILVGTREIANIGNTYVQAFKELGHDASLVVWERNPFYTDTEYSKVLREIDPPVKTKRNLSRLSKAVFRVFYGAKEFASQLRKTDLFIYLYSSSFLPFYFDYPILRLAGKKMISVFCGDDIRFGEAVSLYALERGYFNELEPYLNTRTHEINDLFLIKTCRIRVAETCSNLIVSSPEMGQLQRKPYMRLHIPINLNNYQFKVHGRPNPKIVHAPSYRGYKGTDVILRTVEELKTEGLQFEFILLENLPNQVVRDVLTDSDIVISQLYSDCLSTFSEEGMATGNAVVGRFVTDSVPSAPPAVNANQFTLKDQLRETITNINQRVQLSYAAREYVEKYFNHLTVAQSSLDAVQSNDKNRYDYRPDFYKKLNKHVLKFLAGDARKNFGTSGRA